MTALSIALVLCVAMVCATRLRLARKRAVEAEFDGFQREISRVEQMVRAAGVCDAELAANIASLRAEIDQLKANAAFRSLG